MVNWLIYPISAAFLWAVVNHLDKYVLDKFCKNREIGGLIIFSSIIGIPVALLIWAFNPDVISINFGTAAIVILAGIIYILGIIPYLYALNDDETSVVAPQAMMLPITTGLLGYLFLDEVITNTQLAGILLTIVGVIILSLNIINFLSIKLKSNVVLLMLLSSFLVGTHGFLFKYFAIDINFWNTVFWLHIGFVIAAIFFLLFVPQYRKQFILLVNTNPAKIITLNFASEIITIFGNLLAYFSKLLVPLAIAETATEGAQPIFVLLIGVVITLIKPEITKENISFKILVQKTFAVLIMIWGLTLIT